MNFTNLPSPDDENVEHPGFNTITKKLFPEIDELSDPLKEEKIKVFIRIRPLLKDEISKKDSEGCYFKTVGDNTLLVNPDFNVSKSSIVGKLPPPLPPLRYTFSKVFQENVSQKEFFDQTTFGMINDFINGQNCLIFTYGVTNSGKTYTMMGEAANPGIMPRAMDVIFNSISGQLYDKANIKPDKHSDVVRISDHYVYEDLKFKEAILSSISSHDKFLTRGSCLLPTASGFPLDSEDDKKYGETFEQELSSAISSRKREDAHLKLNSSSQIRYSVWVSMVEIYNDIPFDLLVPLPKKKLPIKRVPLKLKEDGHGLPYVKDLKEIYVTNADEAFKLLAIGKRNLQIASTSLNQVSSRSHCIFNVKLIKIDSRDDQMVAKISSLSLCDLAGSELNSKLGNIGERFKEANNINLSLMVLGRCIESLRQNQMNPDPKKQIIIPFRESKLTKLFQNFLIGKGQASMIVQINKLRSMIPENIKTIKFSALTNQVVMMPVQTATVSMKNVDRRSENLEQPECKKKRMTIEWADENLSADDDYDDDDADEDDDTPIVDAPVKQQSCSEKELQLEKEIQNLRAKYKEMESVYETRVKRLLEIQRESEYNCEAMYKNRLAKQADYYEAMVDRRVNFCLEDSKEASLVYEKTIADLKEELKFAKSSSSEEISILRRSYEEKIIALEENLKLVMSREVIPKLNKDNSKEELKIEHFKFIDASEDDSDQSQVDFRNDMISKNANLNNELFINRDHSMVSKEFNDQIKSMVNESVDFKMNRSNGAVNLTDVAVNKADLNLQICQLENQLQCVIESNVKDNKNFDLKEKQLIQNIDALKGAEIQLTEKLRSMQDQIDVLKASEFGLKEKLGNFEIENNKNEKLIGENFSQRIISLSLYVRHFSSILSFDNGTENIQNTEKTAFGELLNSFDLSLENLFKIKDYYETSNVETTKKIKDLVRQNQELNNSEISFKSKITDMQISIGELKNKVQELVKILHSSPSYQPQSPTLVNNSIYMNADEEEPMDLGDESVIVELKFNKGVDNIKSRLVVPPRKRINLIELENINDKAIEMGDIEMGDELYLKGDVLLNKGSNSKEIELKIERQSLKSNLMRLNEMSKLKDHEEDSHLNQVQMASSIVFNFDCEKENLILAVEDYKKKITELNYKITELLKSETYYKEINIDLENKIKSYSQLEIDNANKSINLNLLIENLESFKKEAEQKMSKLELDCNNYKSQMSDIYNQCTKLEHEKETYLEKNIEFQNIIFTLEQKIVDLEQIERINNLQQNFNDLENENTKLLEQIEVLCMQNKSLEQLNTENKNSIDDINFKLINQIKENELHLNNIRMLESHQTSSNNNVDTIELLNNQLLKELNINKNLTLQIHNLEANSIQLNQLDADNKGLINDLTKKNLELEYINSVIKHNFKIELESKFNKMDRLEIENLELVNQCSNLHIEIDKLKVTSEEKDVFRTKLNGQIMDLETELVCKNGLINENYKLKQQIEELQSSTDTRLNFEREKEQKISDLNDKISSLVNSEIMLRNENLLLNKKINDLKIKIQEMEKFNDQNDKTHSDFENVFLDNQSIDFKTSRSKKKMKTPKSSRTIPNCLLKSRSQNIPGEIAVVQLDEALTRTSKRLRKLNKMDEVYTNTPNHDMENAIESDITPLSNLTYKLRSKKKKVPTATLR